MKNMTEIRNLLIRSTLALALTGLVAAPAAGFAQEKGATRLMQRHSPQNADGLKAIPQGRTPAMSCPKCTDSWVTQVEKTHKAAQPVIRHQVQRHDCDTCSTRIVTEGTGKQAKDVAKHVCRQCGPKDASCCQTPKSVHPEPGASAHQGLNH